MSKMTRTIFILTITILVIGVIGLKIKNSQLESIAKPENSSPQ